jgi:N-acetyl-gamma-glutamyl-phosphate reductase
MIKAGIIGGAGYTGGELIRILIQHPKTEISFVWSKSNAGKKISSIHTDLEGETELTFSDDVSHDTDIIFFCTGHGESTHLLSSLKLPDRIKVIDLSNDFRLKTNNISENRHFVYGLPEINRQLISFADSVANPGCFATAIQLAILPLVAEGHENDFYITGITGSTGAGQSLSQTSHFSWRTNNIQAYKTLSHQHQSEIMESCIQVSKKNSVSDVHFVPWRGDFARGIFVSAQTKSNFSAEELKKIYTDFYHEAVFVHLSDEAIHLKQVINTNKCLIQIEKVKDQLVVHAVIDNLLKGASGQAVQNMNLMFNLGERTGLHLKATAF